MNLGYGQPVKVFYKLTFFKGLNMSIKKLIKLFFSVPILVFFLPLQASQKLSFCGELMPPYLIKSETNTLSGIDIEILKTVLNKIQVNYDVEEMPWPKCEEGLKAGVYDGALGTSKNELREVFLFYPNNISWSSEFVFFTYQDFKKKNPRMTYENITKNNYKVGVIEKNSYHPTFWDAFPWVDKAKGIYNKHLEPSKNVETNFLKLSKQRIDLYPQDKQIGISTLRKLNINDLLHYEDVLFKKDYYFVFSKKSQYSTPENKSIQDVLKKFDQELSIFKRTNQYKKLFLKASNN